MSRRSRKKRYGDINEPMVAPQSTPNTQVYMPFAMPVQPNVAVVMPNTGNYQSYGAGTIIGLPQYQSIDEYGRGFQPPIIYGAQPCSAPIPVPRPASIVQTTPITMPLQITYEKQLRE